MNVLGIETSCDETAAAVVADGITVLSSVVRSQMAVHSPYGGVVPELASRQHMEAIVPVVREALTRSGLDVRGIHAIAVTQGPGLVGALLVGFSFGRAQAFVLDIPWVGVNHLSGHVSALFLEPDPPPFPFVVLLASGGHTGIYHVTGHTSSRLLGQTRDDAAGEAFDKVAKLLGLGYPGGGVIGRLAESGDRNAIAFPRPLLDRSGFDFSFSGLKTAVLRYVQTHPDTYQARVPDIAAGFQESVADVLVHKLIHAAAETGCGRAALVGGVAANGRLRERLRHAAADAGITVHIPSVDLCGDNAAMIAAAGFHALRAGIRGRWTDDVFSRVPKA